MRNSTVASRRLAANLVGWQAVVALVVAALFLVRSTDAAAAALFGGVVIVAPTAWFALKVLVRPAAENPRRTMGTFHWAEAVKLVLMALGFWLGTLWFGRDFLPLLVAVIACLAVNWAMLAVAKNF